MASAKLHFEVRHPAEARSMEVARCGLCLDVRAEARRVPGVPEAVARWEPRVCLDPPLAIPGRSFASVDGVAGQYGGALYVFQHRTLETSRLEFSDLSPTEIAFRWEGAAAVLDHERLPVSIAARAKFEGVTVYEANPDRAATLLADHLDDEGLVPQPPFYWKRGRRKWLLFGDVVGALGYVKYLPAGPPR